MRIATTMIIRPRNSEMGTMALTAMEGGLSKLVVSPAGGIIAGICASCSGVSEDRSILERAREACYSDNDSMSVI